MNMRILTLVLCLLALVSAIYGSGNVTTCCNGLRPTKSYFRTLSVGSATDSQTLTHGTKLEAQPNRVAVYTVDESLLQKYVSWAIRYDESNAFQVGINGVGEGGKTLQCCCNTEFADILGLRRVNESPCYDVDPFDPFAPVYGTNVLQQSTAHSFQTLQMPPLPPSNTTRQELAIALPMAGDDRYSCRTTSRLQITQMMSLSGVRFLLTDSEQHWGFDAISANDSRLRPPSSLCPPLDDACKAASPNAPICRQVPSALASRYFEKFFN
jgi:hypothetical protein